MKAGGLQRTNSLFWFMACHVIAIPLTMVRVKCLAQAHNTNPGPDSNPDRSIWISAR